MTLGTTSRRFWLTTAVLLLVISVCSVAWVLTGEPPVASDQAFRATMAGWGIGIGGLLLSVASLVIALRSAPAHPEAPPVHPSEPHITQVVDGGSIGTIGGTHTWGGRDSTDDPR